MNIPLKQPKIRLSKDVLARIDIGQSFAEYDLICTKPEAFVKTPAINAALDSSHSKCFFVGRRGTGKTAITYYRMIKLVKDSFEALNNTNEKDWFRQINRVKEIAEEMNDLRKSTAWDCKLLIDRIDESWNGSDEAVILYQQPLLIRTFPTFTD